MSFTIAVAGKGGTGKTTISSLIIRDLLKRGKKPIFAVDADANVNLNEQLGVEVEKTIGGVREDMLQKVGVGEMPSGMTKEQYMEYELQDSLVEAEGFDLLVMGRPEGPGCYCYANNLLRRYMEILAKNYPYVVIDNEAGMEHLSRRTTQKIDLLLVVSEPNPISIMTAARIRDLAKDLKIDVKKVGLIVNRVNGESPEILKAEAEKYGLELAGIVPADATVVEYSWQRRPATKMPDDAPSVMAVTGILDKFVA